MKRVSSSPTRLTSCCRACILLARTTSTSTPASKKRGSLADRHDILANFVIFLTISKQNGAGGMK